MQTEFRFRIAICDNAPEDRKTTVDLATQILQELSIGFQISEYAEGIALWEDIQNGVQYDLLLLEAQLEDLDGLTLAAKLRQQNNDTAIIFISVNRELALCGYEVAAARYLAKPLEREKLKEALLYCCKKRQTSKEILLPTNQGQFKIPCSEIRYVEAFERGARVFLADEVLITKLKFNEIDAMLPKASFVMCHRAYIVNLAYAKRIGPKEFELEIGTRIPISKYRYQQIKRQFSQYVGE